MSNLPSMRLVSWNTELGVGVTFTSMPFFSKKPFSLATQIGQLKPPGKTMRLTVCSGAAGGGITAPFGEAGARVPDGPPAHATSTMPNARIAKLFRRCMSPPLKSGLLRIVRGQMIPHSLGDAPFPGRSGFRLSLVHARRLVGEPRVEGRELHPRRILEEYRERHCLLRSRGAGHRPVDVHHDRGRLAHGLGDPHRRGVVADQRRIGPERDLRIEVRALAVTRPGREPQRGDRTHSGGKDPADRGIVAATLVDLLMHPALPTHA